MNAYKRLHHGFSMIELMVATVIALLLRYAVM
ncbi:MAG: prepilin-type N-terminal cleavage/methylation domain-containing protein [Legionella sp.]